MNNAATAATPEDDRPTPRPDAIWAPVCTSPTGRPPLDEETARRVMAAMRAEFSKPDRKVAVLPWPGDFSVLGWDGKSVTKEAYSLQPKRRWRLWMTLAACLTGFLAYVYLCGGFAPLAASGIGFLISAAIVARIQYGPAREHRGPPGPRPTPKPRPR